MNSEFNKFNTEGFVVKKKFFSKSEILTIQKKISEIIINVSEEINIKSKKKDFYFLINNTLPKIYKKNKKMGSYIFDTLSRLNIFRDLTNNKKTINKICEILKINKKDLLSAKFSLFLFTKLHKNHAIGWHQESAYYSDPNFKEFQFIKKTNSLFTWIPLTKTYPGNGALILKPGSHNITSLKHIKNNFNNRYKGSWNKRGEIYIKNFEKISMKYKSKTISSNPGDIIFVDFNTLHKSGINKSNKTRVGVIMRFGEKLDPKEMLN
jgi:ectoine hydroxylase-related dioxygenase (phytanoyl-CoA dioxygenase family)